MKILINKCFGGYGLSEEAMMAYAKRKGFPLYADKVSRLFVNYSLVPIDEFKKLYAECKRTKDYEKVNKVQFSYSKIERTDPDLIAVVEEIGCESASAPLAELSIVEIPDGISYEIEDYDGMETVSETHRSWS